MMEKNFIGQEENRESEKILFDALKKGIDFKRGALLKHKTQEQIKKDLLEDIPLKGKDMTELMEEFSSKILDGSINFSSTKFLAFPDAGNSVAGLTGHILSGFMNQNLINSEHTSPTATFVEIAVIRWLRELIGYDVCEYPKDTLDIGGISVTGGVSANTTALLLARENKFQDTISKGIKFDTSKIKVFIPKGISHYSIRASMGWIGLGKDNCVEVKTAQGFVMDKKDLEEKIANLAKEDVPLAIIAYAGDSRTMSIDNFEEIYQIAKKNNIWFHIDACHGFSLCFSEKLKEKVKGINLADSITLDPHKVLFLPYACSYLLVKDPHVFSKIAGVSDLITKEPFSLGQITPFFGSRAFNSLKTWFVIKNLGKDSIGKIIDERHALAKHFKESLDKREQFYAMNEVNINSVVFLYCPNELKKNIENDFSEGVKILNHINKNIQYRMFAEGSYYIHTFLLNDVNNVLGFGTQAEFQMLRIMPGNPLLKKEDFEGLIDRMIQIGKEEGEILKNAQK